MQDIKMKNLKTITLTVLSTLFFGFLISKSPLFGILLLAFLIFLFWLFLNFKIGLVLVILVILAGQLARFSLPSGGSIVLNDFLIPLIFFVWLLIKLRKKEIPIYKNPLNWPLGLFILIAVFSLLLNWTQFLPSEILQSSAYLLRFIGYALVFYLVLDSVQEERTFQKFYSLAIWLGLLFAFLGFLQLVFIPSFEFMTKYGWDPHLNRLLSTFFDPNYAGGFLVLVCSLVLGRMLFAENKGEKGVLFFAFLFLLLAIVLTYSRSTYLAFIIVALVIGLLRSWRLLLFGFLASILIFFTFPRMQERILGAFSLDITAKMRIASFKDAWQIIEDHPIFGVGYNTLRLVREDYGQIVDPKQHTAGGFDSSLLTIWATTGILGLLAYLWLCFRILKESFWDFWNKKAPPVLRGLALGIFAGFLGLIAHSQFVNSLLYPHIMVYLWFVLGLLYTRKEIKMDKK